MAFYYTIIRTLSPQYIEELNKEELSLIELEQSYKEEERSEKLNKLLLIISLLSIFQVVEIFSVIKIIYLISV